MRRFVLQFGLMLLTLGVLPFAYADVGKVRLQVVDSQTQRPVEGVQVIVIPRQGPQQNLSVADDGRIQSEGLSPGLYEILISRTGYQTARLPSVRVVDGKTTSLRVDLFVQRQNVEEVVVLGTAIGAD